MDHILVLIEQYGYLIIFLGVMLESAGVLIPGETVLIASGILAQQGRTSRPLAACLAGVAGLIGELLPQGREALVGLLPNSGSSTARDPKVSSKPLAEVKGAG